MKIQITKEELVAILQSGIIKSLEFSVDGELPIKQDEKPRLWYPDDSGKWIECGGVKPNLRGVKAVNVLYEDERLQQKYVHMNSNPNVVAWHSIVAYRHVV